MLRTSNAKLVPQSKGRLDCSYTKPVDGLPGKSAYLNGKTVTFKVNGSNPITAAICSALKGERTLHPTIIGGSSPQGASTSPYMVQGKDSHRR